MEQCLLAVGNYGNSIKIYEYSDEKLEFISEEMGIDRPSFLAVDQTRQFLFAVSEADEVEDGFVSAYSIHRGSKKLTLLDRQPTFGSGSCHVAVSPDNRYVVVSNYGSGSVSTYLLASDGKLSFIEVLKNQGEQVSQNIRQQSPHAHGAFFYENGFFSVDLGLDCALFYELNESGEAVFLPERSLFTKAGNGPRHLAILNDYAYVLGELTSEITVFELKSIEVPKIVSIVSTLPDGFEGESLAAAISFSADKKTLYCTNRGHDSIAIFDVLQERVELIDTIKTRGLYPRDFSILTNENYFVFANQNSDTLTVVENNGKSDNKCGCHVVTPKPTCVIML